MSWKTHGKTIVALLAALVVAGIVGYQQVAAEGVTPSEWIMVCIAVFTTFTVWAAANISGFEKAKTLMAAIGLVLSLLVSMITDGLSRDEVLLLAVQFLGALGVAGAPAPKQVVERTVVSR